MRANTEKIQLARARACMSSNQLHEATGMPRGTYLNVITGKGVRPETLGLVAKALGVDVTELLEEE